MSKARKEAARRFPVGASVRLSVGGPVMAVGGVTDSGRVVCQWFDGKQLHEAKFAPEVLVAVEPEPAALVVPAAVAEVDGKPRKATAGRAGRRGNGPTDGTLPPG